MSLHRRRGPAFIACPHHQIANITGRRPAIGGAVVNGPNDATLFKDGLGEHVEAMPACPADGVDRYAAFTGHGSRFVDDVRSWQASEPADDFAVDRPVRPHVDIKLNPPLHALTLTSS